MKLLIQFFAIALLLALLVPSPGTTAQSRNPKDKEFSIFGEIQSPGIYITAENLTLTLTRAIKLAGGMTERAWAGRVQVYRHNPDGVRPLKYRINLSAIVEGKERDFALEDGDTVIVNQLPR